MALVSNVSARLKEYSGSLTTTISQVLFGAAIPVGMSFPLKTVRRGFICSIFKTAASSKGFFKKICCSAPPPVTVTSSSATSKAVSNSTDSVTRSFRDH